MISTCTWSTGAEGGVVSVADNSAKVESEIDFRAEDQVVAGTVDVFWHNYILVKVYVWALA